MVYVDIGLVLLCLTGLAGLTLWTVRQITEMNDRMSKHENKGEVHVDAATFVKKEVCNLQVKMITESVNVVKHSVDKLEQTFKDGLVELKQMVLANRGTHGAD